MKHPPQIILAFRTQLTWGRNLIRGIAAFTEQNQPWDCDFNLIGRMTAETIHRAASADGIIAGIENARVAFALAHLKVPVVAIGASAGPTKFPTVRTDSVAIGQVAAKHLIDRGFRRFGYCAIFGTSTSKERGHAFTRAVKAAGYSCDWFKPSHRRTARSWQADHAALIRWVTNLPKPVGVFAVGDAPAREVARACRDAGIPVPEQVAILGVDNDELLCRLCNPILSSIDAGHIKMGYEAARLLQRMLDGRAVPKRPLLVPPVRVIARESTDIVAVEDPNLAAALRYIQENLADGVSVKQLVQHMSVSRRNLEMMFRKQLGRTIHNEIALAKVHRASRLLADGQTSLAQITEACGMRHPSRLNNLLKKCTGMTPMQYRNAGSFGKFLR